MNNYHSFIEQLKIKLNGTPLPGLEVQMAMAPATRQEELRRKMNSNEARQSAVLVLFYPIDNSPHLIFIKRPVDDTVHSGQIAFPGGRVEPDDRSFANTALREANEEVNIDPGQVTVIGSLSKLHIPPSNFDVYPIIGFSKSRHDLKGNYEVDRILEVSIDELLDPKTKTYKTINHRLGKLVDVPCYFVEGEIIWGATAMMLGELLEIVK